MENERKEGHISKVLLKIIAVSTDCGYKSINTVKLYCAVMNLHSEVQFFLFY